MNADLYSLENSKVGTLELPEEIFGAKWRAALVQQVLLAQMANRRSPWAHAKDRSEVSGSGKKPWRQKGTGRARHGSIRSPLWVGGGKAHGPVKTRDFSQKVNKKMRRVALLSVLSKKLKAHEVKVFDHLDIAAPKTKMAWSTLARILKPRDKKMDVLLVVAPESKNLFRAGRNLVKTKIVHPQSLSVTDVLNYKNIFIDQKAIPVLEKTNNL